jgi:mannose-6-phosphate isomerase-like protein (cupin superfamily)
MRHPYLIRLDEPADWLDVHRDVDPHTGDLIEEQHDILWPEGPNQMYEFNDSHFFLSTTYHEHNTGWETFFIHQGQLDLSVRGRVATVDPEDIIFIPPYTSHKMTMLTKPVIWNGLFHDIGMLTTLNNWALILKSNPGMLDDPEIQANYLGNKNNILRENPFYEERVSKYELHEIRPYDKPFAVYSFPGGSMRQYTGRWENNGKTELWLAELGKGFAVRYKKVNANVDLFYIIKGEVKFNVAGEEFVAGPRCLVKIPHYAPRSFETLSDVRMYDAGGSTHWLDFFGDLKSLKMMSPEKYADKEYLAGVFKRHECYIESASFNRKSIF